MKKFIKNNIIGFILGGLVFGSIVYAYSYNAKDISFSPSNSNWNVNNVKSAIDSIKNTNDTTIANLQSSNSNKDQTIASLNSRIEELENKAPSFGTEKFTSSVGDILETRTASLNLNKGKYLVVVSYAQAWQMTPRYTETISTDPLSITCTSNNCNVSNLSSHANGGSSTQANNSYYSALLDYTSLYYVDVEANTTLTYSHSNAPWGGNNTARQHIRIAAVPIS